MSNLDEMLAQIGNEPLSRRLEYGDRIRLQSSYSNCVRRGRDC